MKKLLLAATLMFLVGVYVRAGESYSVPSGDVSNPINADYGGVDLWLTNPTAQTVVSTVAIPLASAVANGTYGYYASTTVPNLKTKWRVYGAYFSTGSCGADWVEVVAATGGYVSATSTTAFLSTIRLFNIYNATAATGGGATICSGVTPLRWPIRFTGNLFMRVNSQSTLLNSGILYWKEND